MCELEAEVIELSHSFVWVRCVRYPSWLLDAFASVDRV